MPLNTDYSIVIQGTLTDYNVIQGTYRLQLKFKKMESSLLLVLFTVVYSDVVFILKK